MKFEIEVRRTIIFEVKERSGWTKEELCILAKDLSKNNILND